MLTVPPHLFSHPADMPLTGARLRAVRATIEKHHYTHCVPSGKTVAFQVEEAIILFSIPANKNISSYLFGEPASVWELTRLWAPDGHERNLLTRAISVAIRGFRKAEPGVVALVSYADPNAGHTGGVYRAASWIFTGQSEESRAYVDASGQVFARRCFHSGGKGLTKAEIEAKGYKQLSLPGKLRFVHPLVKRARKLLKAHERPYR